MLESGEAKSLKEIAEREGIDNSYVSWMVNLTTLAPDIVAAILDETLPPDVTLFDPPALWGVQRTWIELISSIDYRQLDAVRIRRHPQSVAFTPDLSCLVSEWMFHRVA